MSEKVNHKKEMRIKDTCRWWMKMNMRNEPVHNGNLASKMVLSSVIETCGVELRVEGKEAMLGQVLAE